MARWSPIGYNFELTRWAHLNADTEALETDRSCPAEPPNRCGFRIGAKEKEGS